MGEHFARGRSAEIFRTEDGKILKLFFPDYPREYAEKEYKNTKIAASLGCTGMQVYDMVERGGRFGFVMDCIDGVSQNDMPGKKPAYLFEAGRDLARCHVRVQKAHTRELDDVREVCLGILGEDCMAFLTNRAPPDISALSRMTTRCSISTFTPAMSSWTSPASARSLTG